jgi:predicted nuclease with RNAse H fold
MAEGFALFDEIGEFATVFEVFPTASIEALARSGQPAPASVNLSLLGNQRKDSLDAVIAAWTARAFSEGQGSEVGGGDGLGTLVLPCPIEGGAAARIWPDPHQR